MAAAQPGVPIRIPAKPVPALLGAPQQIQERRKSQEPPSLRDSELLARGIRLPGLVRAASGTYPVRGTTQTARPFPRTSSSTALASPVSVIPSRAYHEKKLAEGKTPKKPCVRWRAR